MNDLHRRQLLSLVASSMLAGCAGWGEGSSRPVIGLLLPLTGDSAGLAAMMRQAVEPADDKSPYALEIFDTGGTPAGSGEAAKQAALAHASLILGPVFGRDVPFAVAAAATIPVITFSDDGDLVGGGAYVFGITPAQTIAAIFAYARAQGVRRVAVAALDRAWGRQSIAAAQILAPRSGLILQQIIMLKATDDPARLPQLLRQGGNPDAVLLPDGGAALSVLAQGAASAGLQILGTSQWSGSELRTIPALRGAWFSAPDPGGLDGILDKTGHPGTAGRMSLLPALAHDAAMIASALAETGNISRAALMREEGFFTTLGRVRFAADGSVDRSLAVLGVAPEGILVLTKAAA